MEWVYVVHSTIFFAVFGTTPDEGRGYRRGLSYVAMKPGFVKKATPLENATEVSGITFVIPANNSDNTERESR